MSTRFWGDSWLGDTPLASQYPNLFNIVQTKNVMVSEELSQAPLNIRFNRTLTRDKRDSWISLVRRLMDVHLTDKPDSFKRRLITTGVF
jgi:hypothetical protein